MTIDSTDQAIGEALAHVRPDPSEAARLLDKLYTDADRWPLDLRHRWFRARAFVSSLLDDYIHAASLAKEAAELIPDAEAWLTCGMYAREVGLNELVERAVHEVHRIGGLDAEDQRTLDCLEAALRQASGNESPEGEG